MADFLTLDDVSFQNKTVLLRADLNVPMKDGRVTDSTSLVRLQPTLRDLGGRRRKIVVLSNFGRPTVCDREKYSLRPVAAALANLGQPVSFARGLLRRSRAKGYCSLALHISSFSKHAFFSQREKKRSGAGAPMAALGDLFVNDAFLPRIGQASRAWACGVSFMRGVGRV